MSSTPYGISNNFVYLTAVGSTSNNTLWTRSNTGELVFTNASVHMMNLSAFDSTTCQMSNNLRVVGTIFATSNITAFSDARYKTDVMRIEGALEKVMEIGGYTYRKVDDVCENVRYAGVMAQEVKEVLPEVVVSDGNGQMHVAYGNMVGLLVEAIKELNVKLAALEEKMNLKHLS